MVELIAIVRRKQASATKAALNRIGCGGYSILPVLGRGASHGEFMAQVLFDLVIEDVHEAKTLEAILHANQTGACGDGRIFLIEVNETYRISTGERVRAEEIGATS
jgi:nitrogen regulatory protein PII